jgi:hypothetical protein
VDGASFYAEGLDPDELVALAVAGQLAGVASEIAIVHVLVRKCVSEGNLRGARDGLDALRGLLKLQLQLDQAQADQVVSNLDRVLDTLAQELGIQP